jgi:hypothetical protein
MQHYVLKTAAAKTLVQGLLCLRWRFSGTDIKLLASAVDQAKVPEQKVAPKQAVAICVTSGVKGLAMCRLIRENGSTKSQCHHARFGVCDSAQVRILYLNAERFQRFQFSSDAAIHGGHGASGVHHEVVTFSINQTIYHEVIAVITPQRNRLVSQAFQILFKRIAGSLLCGCCGRTGNEDKSQPEATMRKEVWLSKLRQSGCGQRAHFMVPCRRV